MSCKVITLCKSESICNVNCVYLITMRVSAQPSNRNIAGLPSLLSNFLPLQQSSIRTVEVILNRHRVEKEKNCFPCGMFLMLKHLSLCQKKKNFQVGIVHPRADSYTHTRTGCLGNLCIRHLSSCSFYYGVGSAYKTGLLGAMLYSFHFLAVSGGTCIEHY